MTTPQAAPLPESVDVVVVGAGGAGMTAALAARKRGLETVLIEKSSYFGGSTARSGGGVWIPNNYALKKAGQDDDPKLSRTYLDRGPEVLDFVRDNTPLRFTWVPQYADYHPEAPGGRPAGRSCEPIPLDARFLGAELDRLHPQYTKAPANMIVTQADFRKISLGLRTLRGPITMAKVFVRRMVAGVLRRKMFAMGNAIAIGLRKGLIDANVPVHYDTELTGLVIEDGAETDLMDDSWWGPTIPLPSGPWFCLAERNLPGSIIVNQAGQRYMNEALPYVEAVHAMYDGEATGVGHVPSWMIVDQRYRNRYIFAGLFPRQPFPGRWYKIGTIRKASSIEELAAEIEVPAEALRATVDRFNGFAKTGVDEDFHRGESAYDQYYSDPTVKPNPSLHTIDEGPFYAVKIVPGDLGTKGGLVTDEHARVVRADGSVIAGLYAAGNVSSAVMGHTYPGPGGTIGPALVFGYLAAE